MKKKLLIGSVALLAISAFIWSCTDEFSEKDYLKRKEKLEEAARAENDSIALSIQVYNASTTSHSSGGRTAGTQGIDGLTVGLSVGGATISETTDDHGIAHFVVQPGSVSGTIAGDGFTTMNFTITVWEQEDDASDEHFPSASVALPVFSTAAESVARVNGNVTFEGNLLNNTRENVPDGVRVIFSPDPNSLRDYYSNVGSSGADVDQLSMEAGFAATVTNGLYSIDLPTGINGLHYNFTFAEFTANQTIAIDRYEGDLAGSVRNSVAIATAFRTVPLSSGNFTDIPSVRPLQIDIEAPPVAGTGASADIQLLPAAVDAGNGFTIVASGTGYPANSNTVQVTVTGGNFDSGVGGAQAALFATTNAAGQVTGITGTLGFGYRSRATLVIGGGGSGAVVISNYTNQIASLFGNNTNATSGSVITNGGSGYSFAPTAVFRGYDANGNYTEVENATQVVDGHVVDISMPSNFFSRLAANNPIIFRPTNRSNAMASSAEFTISNAGEVTGLVSGADGMSSDGSGYNATISPAVIVRGLRGGTGALIGAEMSGQIVDNLFIISQGSGYSTSTNANFPTTSVNFSTSGITSGTSLKAGASYVLNAHYGTGTRSAGVQ